MPYDRKTYDLFISDELKQILTEFESDSEVASLLLKKRHDKQDLVDSPVNFISISREDKTKISYLTTERMSSIDISEYWTSSRRFQAKPGAFISKIFTNISSKEIEKFSNLYRATVSKPKFTFEIISGENMRQFYHYESYAQDRGTLGSSCMKHDSCQSFLNIYTENPEVVSMLVMKNDENQLMGRTLLWKFDSYKIMDRIYTICDEDLSFYFKTWATQNGYLYKSEQNWYNTLNFEQLGQKKQELQLKIKLKNYTFRRYPYVDTFKFLDLDTGELTNYIPESINFKTLCSSDGSYYDNRYLIFDGIDRVLRHRGESVNLEYLNVITHSNNAQWSDINKQFILNEHCRYDQHLEDIIFTGEYKHLNDSKKIKEKMIFLKNRELRDIISEIDLDVDYIKNIKLILESRGVQIHNEISELIDN